MEDNFFRRIIDREDLIVDQWKDDSAILRISWFKDNHYQCEKWICLRSKEYHKYANQDWYPAGYGLYIDIYFTHDNRYISFDYDCNGEYIYRSYNLQELFDSAET